MEAQDVVKFFGGKPETDKIYILSGEQLGKFLDLFLRMRITSIDSSIKITDKSTNGTDLSVASSSVPSGNNQGDMLYWDGSSWIILDAPAGGSLNWVLRFDIATNLPYWEQPGSC